MYQLINKMSKNLINGMKPEFGNLAQIKLLQAEQKSVQDEVDYKTMRKNMNPLEKCLDSHANIGWSHFAIDNLKKLVQDKLKTKHPIEQMINKATGYDKGIIKAFLINLRGHFKELVKNYRYVVEDAAVEDYKNKIKEIDNALKTHLKDTKAIELSKAN